MLSEMSGFFFALSLLFSFTRGIIPNFLFFSIKFSSQKKLKATAGIGRAGTKEFPVQNPIPARPKHGKLLLLFFDENVYYSPKRAPMAGPSDKI